MIDVGTGQNPGKTVAIILGGAAGVGFLVILMMFARGVMKKRDGMHYCDTKIDLYSPFLLSIVECWIEVGNIFFSFWFL